MATLKELHTLVHALDKGEKKTVSIMIDSFALKARQRYAHAFRIINEQAEFDKDKLKEKLSVGLQGMSLTEANDNVFHFICRALYGHASPATGNLGLIKELTLVEIFVEKGLFEIAGRFLEPLLKKLNDGNSFGLLARGQELHSIITASSSESNTDFPKRKGILASRMQNAKDHLQYLEILQLNQDLTELIQLIGEPREKKHLEAYEHIFKNPIWQLPYSAISRKAFVMYAPLRTSLASQVKGLGASLQESVEALEEFYKRFDVAEHYVPAFYLIDNLLSDCIAGREKQVFFQYTGELRKLLLYARQRAVIQKINAKIMQCEIAYDIFTVNTEQGIMRLENWMRPDVRNTWKEAPLAYMNYLYAARLCYLGRKPAKALDYLDAIRDREKDFRASSWIAYRFLYLLCYYQLNNASLIFSTANSIYKSLLKHKQLYAPEKAILRFAKGSGTVEKIKKNMAGLHKTLKGLRDDPMHQPFFQFADYVEWLEVEMSDKKR